MGINTSRIEGVARPALIGGALLAVTLLAQPSVDPAIAAGCKDSGTHPYQLGTNQARAAVTCLINKERRRHHRGALQPTRSLRSAARLHSKHMERDHCFSHRCAGEAGLRRRVAKTSYLPCNCTWGLGETIAWAKSAEATPRRVVHGWMHSGAHRATVLDPRYRNVGVGVIWGGIKSSSAKAGIYTADFGFKR